MFKTSCRECALSQLCLPLGLDKQQVNNLDINIKHNVSLKRGEVLYRKGDVARSLHIVRSGVLKAVVQFANKAQIVGFFLPGEFIGFDGISSKHHSTTVIALETSSVCEVGVSDLFKMATQMSRLQTHLFELMSQEINIEISSHFHCSAETQLVHFLLQLSLRFKRRGLSANEFRLPMTRQDIANYLGLATETVSRTLTKFQASNLIKLDRRNLVIPSRKVLEELMTGCRHKKQESSK
jgi:CRP/FNR family transcriptional regulator, anaerobic regulatory protein